MSNAQGLAIARRLIAEEAEKKAGFLDLGMLGLSKLPDELFALTHLKSLNLGQFYQDSDGNHRGCTNSLNRNDFSKTTLVSHRGLTLESIWLINVQLGGICPISLPTSLESFVCTGSPVSDLSPVSGLKKLQLIECSLTEVSDLTPLSGLMKLQTLGCGARQVSDLSPLSGLIGLRFLSCTGTRVINLSPLSGLENLQSLYCGLTQVNDLSPVAGLTSLRALDCNRTGVSDLSPLLGLTSLQSFNCGLTQVNDLSPLSGLTSLKSLDCSGTGVSDLSPLLGLKSLQSIDCSSTQVSDLSPISALTLVSRLVADNCRLESFPVAIVRAEPAVELRLFETKIPGIPTEVLSQSWGDDCRERLLGHVNDLKAGAEQVADVKVIVIGNGRIGKTQICNRLRRHSFEEQANSTHGITVTQTKLPLQVDSDPAVLNLWDFGGQDLYHGTHSLFLKSRAVFVVVWTPKAESTSEYEFGGMRFRNQPLPYWLEYVRNAAGNVCPVVLVQNQCDTPQDEVRQPPADASVLDAFPYLQQVQYSARFDRKRDSLNEALCEAIKYLRGQEGIATIGKGRMKVRRQLQQWLDEDSQREPERRQHRTFSQTQFRELCISAGDVSSPESLLDYLHNAGIVFYQRGLFNNSIVLDQSWALDAIYTVFNRQQCYRQLSLLGGRFTRSLLEALVWPAEEYSAAEQELFLSMMESCGICFKHRSADAKGRWEAEYVAPDLLPDRNSVQDQLAGRWDEDAPKAERSWSFSFLHPGHVRSIISTIGSRAGDTAVYWKYGVWFYDANSRCTAIIAQETVNERQGRIVLQTQGDRARELLAVVTDWIQGQIGSDATCSEDGDVIVASKHEMGRLPASPEAAAATPIAPIRITDPPRPANQVSVCVSYAWKEELSKDPNRAGKVDLFCTKLRQTGRSIIRDNTHLVFGDCLSTFMRQIGHGDRIYIFLSDAYLKSPNCMYELHTIWQTSGDDKEQFRQRTRVFTMPGTEIFSIPARLKYAAHWKKQLVETQQVINENGVDVLGPTDLKNFKQMQDFAHHVNEMLAQIVDVLQPREFDQFIDRAIEEGEA